MTWWGRDGRGSAATDKGLHGRAGVAMGLPDKGTSGHVPPPGILTPWSEVLSPPPLGPEHSPLSPPHPSSTAPPLSLLPCPPAPPIPLEGHRAWTQTQGSEGDKSRSKGLFGILPGAAGSSERPESSRTSSQARQHCLPGRLDSADGTALLTVGAVASLTPLPAVPHRASQGRAGPVTCQLLIPLRPTALVPGGSEWGPG